MFTLYRIHAENNQQKMKLGTYLGTELKMTENMRVCQFQTLITSV